MNQLGYLPDRPKHATLISDARGPIHFTVRDDSGIAVFTGLSEPWSVRPEPTSGLMVHVLDFSNLDMPGAGFRIEAATQCSHPFEITSRLYDVLAVRTSTSYLRVDRIEQAIVDWSALSHPLGPVGYLFEHRGRAQQLIIN